MANFSFNISTGLVTRLKVFVLVAGTVYAVIYGIIPGWNTIKTDFPNYYISAKVIFDGGEVEKLYDNEWFQQQIYDSDINALGKFSPQPPVASYVMLPIAWMKAMPAKRVWLVCGVCFMAGSIFLTRKLFELTLLDASLIMILMGRALFKDLYYGQLYLMVIFGMLLVLWLVNHKEKEWLGGVVLAIVTVLKYLPIVLLVYFLLEKRNRVVMGFTVSIAALFLLQFVGFGADFMRIYIYDILPAHFAGDLPGQGGFAVAYQSWPSFFNNLFVFDSIRNPAPIVNWSEGRSILVTIFYIFTLGLSGWFIFRLKESKVEFRDELMILILIITALALLPAGASYHFMFILIPLTIVWVGKFDIYQLGIVALVVAINFFPYPFNNKENILMLILSYPRLIAINLILILTYLHVSKHLKPNLE